LPSGVRGSARWVYRGNRDLGRHVHRRAGLLRRPIAGLTQIRYGLTGHSPTAAAAAQGLTDTRPPRQQTKRGRRPLHAPCGGLRRALRGKCQSPPPRRHRPPTSSSSTSTTDETPTDSETRRTRLALAVPAVASFVGSAGSSAPFELTTEVRQRAELIKIVCHDSSGSLKNPTVHASLGAGHGGCPASHR